MGTPVGCVQVRLGACVRYDGYAMGMPVGVRGGVWWVRWVCLYRVRAGTLGGVVGAMGECARWYDGYYNGYSCKL